MIKKLRIVYQTPPYVKALLLAIEVMLLAIEVMLLAIEVMLLEDKSLKHLSHFESQRGLFSYPLGNAGYLRNQPSKRKRITPKRASLKIPPLILLVPSTRLTKMTGTSLILNPIL